MFLRNIFEELSRTGQGKTAVIGWGRGMGHKGHMYLASSVITHAKQLGADPYFVVSRTVGKDDPINPEEKLAIYKKVFPEQGHIFQTATDDIPDLTRVLSNLNQQGYTSVTIVLGADQVKAFQYLKNYNGKANKAGDIPYTFDKLDVISRQETNDPSKDQEGPRATPMRAILMDPKATPQQQFQLWRDAMNPEIDDQEVIDLMNKAKERMTAMTKPKKKGVAEGLLDYTRRQQLIKFLAKKMDWEVSYLELASDPNLIKWYKAVQAGKNPMGENSSKAIDHTAKSLENPPKVMQHRAKRDQERERQWMGTQIAKRDTSSKDNWGNFKEGEADYGGDYQAMVKRVGQQAKEGPRKTVWDPEKRVYKTVPVNAPKDKKVAEKMLPKSAFAGSNKNKLGSAGQLKGSMKRPAKAGDLVGGMEEGKIKGVDGKACWKGTLCWKGKKSRRYL